MAGVVFKYSLLTAFLVSPICSLAGDPEPPPNRHFEYNFLPLNSWQGENSKNKIFAACGVGNIPIGRGSKGDRMCDDDKGGPSTYKDRFVHEGYIADEVLYIQEVDKDSGIWHQVLIDENHGFKMDIYISMSMGTAGLGQAKSMSGGKNAGHVWPIDPRSPGITGTGTGDPTRVNYRMLIEDADFTMDMLKDSWNKKPKITQVVADNGVYSSTEIDMSNSSFSDMNTPAIIKHNQQITDVADWDFDSRFDGDAVITGGRYRISSSSGDNIDPTYYYADAPTNYGKNLDWTSFWQGSPLSNHWQPGEPYGYPEGDSGDSGKDEDKKW